MDQKQTTAARLAAKRRRRTLMLILGCCAIALLAGASALLTAWQQKQDAASAAAADSSPSLPVGTLPASGSVDAIAFTDTAGRHLTFLQQADGSWQLEDIPDMPLNTSMLDAVLDAAVQLYAYAEFTGAGALSDYGLETPNASVTLIDTATGESNTLAIGDKNAVTGQYYLQSSQSAETLYMVDDTLLAALQLELYALVTPEELGAPTPEALTGLSIQTPTAALVFTPWQGAADTDLTGAVTWQVTQNGLSLPVDSSTGKTLISRLCGIDLTRCVAWEPTETELQLYGLDEASRTAITLTGTEGEFSLYLGNTTESGEEYYLTGPALSGIYTVTASSIGNMRDVSALDYVTTLPFAANGAYLSAARITGAENVDLTVTVAQGEDDTVLYTLNGEELDTDTGNAFWQTVASLTGVPALAVGSEVSGEPAYSFTYTLQDCAWSEAVWQIYAAGDGYTVVAQQGPLQTVAYTVTADDWQAVLDTLR